MEIIKIKPQGFCGGVKHALDMVDKAILDPNTKRPIYLLGNLIHNKYVIEEYKRKGVIVIEGPKKRFDLLDEINEGTVIFSAHGVSDRVYEKALNKGLNIIDATCPNVLVIHNQVKKYLKLNYSIIYIGTNNHPESEAIIEISDKIYFITSKDDINNLPDISDNIYITNQTTLSIYDIKDIYDSLKCKYPNAVIDNKICLATTKRQEVLKNQEGIDVCIVVGDTTSSNSRKLVSVSENVAHVKSYLVESENDLTIEMFKGANRISVTSGASTPSIVVDKVIDKIKGLKK